MYKTIKKSVKTLIPKNFLFKNELFFRKFYGLFYIGKKHQCNICNKQLKAFVLLENKDLLCPFCGSLSRNRRLWKLLNEEKRITENILHFSPSRSLYRNLKKQKKINYYSTDFENEFLADYKFDITNIKQESNKFDTIICYHILEHIVEDRKAMSELYRVLKQDGKIYVQTPFKSGNTYEDASIVSPEGRKKHFDQEDHVRIYSIEGLKSRLENNGFKVLEKTYLENNDDLYFGFKSPETVLIATK